MRDKATTDAEEISATSVATYSYGKAKAGDEAARRHTADGDQARRRGGGAKVVGGARRPASGMIHVKPVKSFIAELM